MREETGRAQPDSESRDGQRSLSLPMFLMLVVVYLAVLQVVGLLVATGDVHHLYTSKDVARDALLPIGVSALFVCAAITWLGWWQPVLIDHRPVQRWVWAVPIIFVIASLIAINYGGLSGKGLGFILLLLLSGLCVGVAEEGMFRGIGVTMLRFNLYTERRVALWSSVIFGLAHLVNAFGTGAGAIGQAVIVSFAGYFFYLTRRVSGGLFVPILMHGLFDFALLSGSVTSHQYLGTTAGVIAYLVAGGLLLVRRHRIEPPTSSRPATASA